MEIKIVKLPKHLTESDLKGRAVVVFDVLRATTTIVTAIASGAKEVRVFGSLDAAQRAASEFTGDKLLAGEHKCVAPSGFDLGNSPGDFTAERIQRKTIFLSTTNGTRAIVAAHGAARMFVAAPVSATATGRMLSRLGMDVTLLCAGTDGAEAPEDEFGAMLVQQAIESTPFSDVSHIHHEFRQCQGGKNIIRAGLEPDIEFAAQIDRFSIVVEVTGSPPIARKMHE